MAEPEATASEAAEEGETALYKERARRRVWDALEDHDLVTYPRPCHGRIPNFVAADVACERIASLPEFQAARVVKVHPSLGATRLRALVLDAGKILLVPPLPGHNFLYFLVDPADVPSGGGALAADKRGFNKYGRPIASIRDIPRVDLVVVASVAVTMEGARLGKGKGYGEIEYAILREVGAVDATTPVATICHDEMVVANADLPSKVLAPHDLPVDVFCTPTRVVRAERQLAKPTGIIWDLVGRDMERDIGALVELRALRGNGLGGAKRRGVASLASTEAAAKGTVANEDADAAVDTAGHVDVEFAATTLVRASATGAVQGNGKL
eukprot:CAMPEP_0117541426 /NCGR_PEP_ID=MMETSP0784-20121206/44014_1 /TAXON_ID=39447 /ORGANISM="" /LENGTH=325 /DNA_ID=CAMNT_0005338123 /DNA_START=52 /DNA_END=1027 /DNA_ORIENTATION=+